MLDSDLPDGVDVVVRYHAPGNDLELDRALFSLCHQTFSPVHPIVVTHAFDAAALKDLRQLVEAYPWQDRHVVPTICNVEESPGQDIRSRLLDKGIAAAAYRFLAILDFDDYLYEHAYNHLVSCALASGAAAAFGGISVKNTRVFKHCVYNVHKRDDQYIGDSLLDLVNENFCPIHSFVLDRTLIDAADLYFDDDLKRLEDYDFLLRLAMKYKFSFDGIGRKVGVYNHRMDGSNSIQIHEFDGEKRQINAAHWNHARRRIWRRKVEVRQVLGLYDLAAPDSAKTHLGD